MRHFMCTSQKDLLGCLNFQKLGCVQFHKYEKSFVKIYFLEKKLIFNTVCIELPVLKKADAEATDFVKIEQKSNMATANY